MLKISLRIIFKKPYLENLIVVLKFSFKTLYFHNCWTRKNAIPNKTIYFVHIFKTLSFVIINKPKTGNLNGIELDSPPHNVFLSFFFLQFRKRL